MTQKDKELLLKDFSARLPYGVCFSFEKMTWTLNLSSIKLVSMFPMNDVEVLLNGKFLIQWCKPYLRQMSSMTEEEDKEYAEVIVKSQDCSLENNESATTMANDWLLSKGFDVRGLISKGLALEAPDGMYNV